MSRWVGLIPVLTTLAATAAAAGEPPVYHAPKVRVPPVVDGRLDDPAWASAPVMTDFVTGRRHEPARYRTEAKFVYDADALYAAITAYEPALDKLQIGRDPNNLWWDDCVELFVDPQATRARYFQYLINAAGTVATSYVGDFAADLPAEAAAGPTPDAWTLEVKMPLAAFGSTPYPGERWGLDVSRARNNKGDDKDREVSLWSPTDGPHGNPGRFGYLIFDSVAGVDPPRSEPDLAVTDRILDRIRAEAHGQWRWTREDVSFEVLNDRATRLLALDAILARFPDRRVLPYVRPAIRDEHILPWTVPAPGEVDTEIALVVCRGEFESASLGLFATRDLKRVSTELSELVADGGGVLPATVAAPYHVQCWYQGGVGTIHRGRTTLLAELLVRDPGLITVDPQSRTNKLHFDPIPTDAATLQPIDIPAFESRQIWITYRIPATAAAGDYRGTLTVRDAGGVCAAVPVSIRVPAWDLPPSPMLHGLYYGRRMRGVRTVEEEDAFFAVLEQELRDQIEHGCNVVATYVGTGPLPSDPSPTATAQRIHEIQRKYGVTGTPYFGVVDHVGFQQGDEQLGEVTKRAKLLSTWARRNGRAGFCFQGRDEASGAALKRERPSWEACRAGGGKMWVACRPSYFESMGDILDYPVVTGRLRPDLARKVHANGFSILSYGNPQTGVEMPAVYRRNYGLALRAAHYDGAIDYEYRTADDVRAWDDFDQDGYRDHNFAHPAVGRPIDTIQFEGWREAVDDVRYAGALQRAIDDARTAGRDDDLAVDSQDWLEAITGYEDDLDAVRAEMVRRIGALTASAAAP